MAGASGDTAVVARRHAPSSARWRIAGEGQAGIIAAYAALYEPAIGEIIAVNPPPSHQPRVPGESYGPALLNVLRVWDVPERSAALRPAAGARGRDRRGLRADSRDLPRGRRGRSSGTLNTSSHRETGEGQCAGDETIAAYQRCECLPCAAPFGAGTLQPAATAAQPVGAEIRVGIDAGDLRGSDNRALQAAVDYIAGLGGGTVHIGPGRFTMRNALTLRDNVQVVGEPGQTILAACPGFSTGLAADGDCNQREITVADPTGLRVRRRHCRAR